MSKDIEDRVEKRWLFAVSQSERCCNKYKAFLTELRLLADALETTVEKIVRDALGNAEKRASKESIKDWMDSIEDKWKHHDRLWLTQADEQKRRKDLISSLGLTPEQVKLIKGEQ